MQIYIYHRRCGGAAVVMPYAIRPIRPSEAPKSLRVELCVDELPTGKRYVVLVQCVDFRPVPAPIGHGLARFTANDHSPTETGDILLRTPAYFRKLEGGDDMDGAQAADLSPLVADHLRRSSIWSSTKDFTAAAKLAASQEPWILCTSIRPSGSSGAASLERQFSYKGPDAVVTTVADPEAFARQLGIELARSVGASGAVKDHSFGPIERFDYWAACGADKDIEAVVRVVHGPVHYYDSTLTVRSADDMARAESYRIWFAKGAKFSPEREYRFAVSTGRPTTDTFRLEISSQLSQLTASRRFGQRWWSA